MGYIEYTFEDPQTYTDFVEAARIVNERYPDSPAITVRPYGEKCGSPPGEIIADCDENWQFFYMGMALMELRIKREKAKTVAAIHAGLDKARKKGKRLGRRKGTTLSSQEVLKRFPAVVKDLADGLSIRKTALFRKVSVNTVQRVKLAMKQAATLDDGGH